MSDQDKLINVVVKYSQQGAEAVAKNQSMMGKSADEFYDKQSNTWDELGKEFQQYQNGYSKGASNIISKTEMMKAAIIAQGKAEADALKYMAQGVNDPTLAAGFRQMADQAEVDARRKADSYASEGTSPGAPGGPLDPAIPKKFNAELENTRKGYQSLITAGQSLSQVANMVVVTGGLMTSALVLNANHYVQTVGRINEHSAKWLGYSEDIKKANLEIGKSATQAMLPTMKMTAELMQKVADIATANPWLVQGIMTAGTIMAAVGGAMKVVGEIMKISGEIGKLIAQAEAAFITSKINSMGGVGMGEYLPGGAGAGMGALGMVTLTATSVIIGAELGMALGNAINKQLQGENFKSQNLQDVLVTINRITQLPWAITGQILGRMGGDMKIFGDAILDWLNDINRFFGEMIGAKEFDTSAEEAKAAETAMITEQETQTFIAYQKQMAESSASYSQQRADIIAQYEEQIVSVTQQYESQRADAISSYNKQMSRSAEDFARNQQKSLDDFNRQTAKVRTSSNEEEAKAQKEFQRTSQKNAQSHALELQRLEAQHNNRLGDLAAQRDALGIVKENQSYALARSEKEKDYRIAEQERKASFQREQAERRANDAQRLIDMRADFDRQRAQALSERAIQVARQAADQAERLSRMDAQHKAELLKMEQQEKVKLSKLDEAYKKQVGQIQSAFLDRLRALDSTILGDAKAFEANLQKQALAFRVWLDNFKSAQGAFGGAGNQQLVHGVIGSHAFGGYGQFFGPGENGKEEFVLNNESTRMAEAMLGSRLSQANLLASLMSSRGGSGSGSRNLQITVQSRNLTMSEIKQQVEMAFDQKLGDLLPAFGIG